MLREMKVHQAVRIYYSDDSVWWYYRMQPSEVVAVMKRHERDFNVRAVWIDEFHEGDKDEASPLSA